MIRVFLPIFIVGALIGLVSSTFNPPVVKPAIAGCTQYTASSVLIDETDPSATTAEFEGKLVHVPQIEEANLASVLGDGTGEKRIEVDLASQKIYAYEGDTRVMEFTVSTGKWNATPTGTFTIERKIKAQKMSGGDKAKGTYYYLPNVPWVMFYGNKDIPWWKGYSFHGAYWHDNFGQPMSHGCVNMRIPEAKQLFDWTPNGTKVVVY